MSNNYSYISIEQFKLLFKNRRRYFFLPTTSVRPSVVRPYATARALTETHTHTHKRASARYHAHTHTHTHTHTKTDTDTHASAHVPQKYYLRREVLPGERRRRRRRRRRRLRVGGGSDVERPYNNGAARQGRGGGGGGAVTGGALCACTAPPNLSAWPAVRALGGALLPFIDQRRRRLGDPHAASASGPTRRTLRIPDYGGGGGPTSTTRDEGGCAGDRVPVTAKSAHVDRALHVTITIGGGGVYYYTYERASAYASTSSSSPPVPVRVSNSVVVFGDGRRRLL
ncbi:Uncharacterized protein FWK35_00016433 [Aphis craccivora]|uniref:Uncharacterized protein n=1 Tax=Aphis craccivora TaxID=307492 RepID=A0A6G0Z7H8_APHCR|nr:Uncharacterized protein FWK35_00016433 [Aphis craccivora]